MKNIVSLSILVLAFCLSEVTLTYFLPLAKTDFDVWLKYFILKDAVYDTMFFLFFLLIFWNVKQRIPNAIATFGVIVSGGSFVDKVVFSLNQYLFSDLFLIGLGVFFAIRNYRKHG
jgi:hypothetical protein